MALDTPGGKQLAGYLVSDVASQDNAQQAILRDALKNHLKAQLPDYMVPAHLILLASMPLTANGKLDRRALPLPDPELNRQHYVAPSNALEQTLAAIWCDVLNVGQVGLNDNFFELGGDSILSIQVVSRARQQGIHFTPRDLFQHQTVQTLAGVATLSQQVHAEQGLLQGESGLTPIQHWFFERQIPNRHHWNQALVLEPTTALAPQSLEQALRSVLQHHDALRLGFSETAGHWRAEHQPLSGVALLQHLCVDTAQACEALFAQAQSCFNLATGSLLRAVLAQLPDGQQRLLIVIHHLVVDGVSWRVLMDDLQTVYRQLTAGQEVQLPAKTSPLRDWAARLQAYAGSESLREELEWWQAQLSGTQVQLPCANPEGGLQERHAETVSVRLDAERTRQLLQQAPSAYRTQVNDLLLTALARVLCRWSGHASALVQLEGHGREALFDDLDLTRTVGWFTSVYPVRLSPAAEGFGASIKAIKEQLRAVPHKGLGHGVLRYLADAATRQTMAGLPHAAITFNYLGQLDQTLGHDALFQPLDAPLGAIHDPEAPLPNELSVDSQVSGGELVLRWTFSAQRHDRQAIASLAEAYLDELQHLIEHCLTDEAGGLTPSDFPWRN